MAGMDFAINLAAGIAKDCVCVVVHQAHYCYGYKGLLEDLGNEKEKLRSARGRMLVQVRKANANSQETWGGLKQQLEEANNLIEKVEKLEGKAKARKNYYCHGVRPNCISRYREGKRAAKMMETVKQLNERIVPQILFANRQSLQPMAMGGITSENFIFFECTKKAHDELLMALKNEEIIRIGLYGMGGCGKTSLVKQVREAAEDLKLFHKVVYVVVSNHPNVRTIQGSIAGWIGLRFEAEENEPERAARLSMTLKNHNRFLIILDDVWEVLRFEDIGIPLGENCKVLLSTRQQQVCTLMDCQEVIHLSLLTEGEAWILFQKYASIIEDTFEDLAREISVECARLPVAIKAVASTLKAKPVVVWEEAMKTLKDCRPVDIERGLENPYKCLKLSFDHLENEEERSLFLLCALFPEDSEISIEILIRFAFGLGLFEDVDSYERARSRVGAAINKITNYCLLLQAQEKHVKMHDLVRDVALWIANKKTQVIMGPKQYRKATTEKDYMKDTTKLYCHDMNEFPAPGQLNCPKLEILFVSIDGGYSSEFPDTFSKEMTELKVLAIKNTSVWTNPTLQLPQSIQGLKKLRTLCLSGWTLDNISILGKLEILVSIELVCCVMNELSRELSDLTKLKLLEISGCRIGGNPYEVLARCSKLEELYFVENILTELVSNDENVPELLHQVGSSTTLQRYHLEIGSSIDILKDDSTSKFISINNFNASTSNEAIKDLAPKLEVLFLEKIQGDYKNIIPDMISTGGGHINQLTEFLLRDCDNIECLIDTTNHQSSQAITVFSKLSKLKIEAMKSLEVLCCGRPPSTLFEKLEELSVLDCIQLHCIVSTGMLNLCHLKFLELEDCPKLTYLFTPASAHTMVLLEVLKVRGCNALKHIIKDEDGDDIISIGSVFLKLKIVNVKGCEDLECIIPASFAGGLSELESLEIEDAHELKYVFGTYNHEEVQNQNELQSIDLPDLKVFRLIDLPNIISICPQNYRITWPSLPKPYIRGCPQLNDIFDTDLEVRQQDGDSSTEELKDANALIEVEELQQNATTNKYGCLGNWIWQCGPPKKTEKKTKKITDPVENSEIIRSSSLTTIPDMENISSSNEFLFLNSRKLAYDELFESLVGDEASMIGLHGTEGCGKTTLAKEVSKAAQQFFDVVIFVVVSSLVDNRKIQDTIASSLCLQFIQGETETERVNQLFLRLSNNEERILIILDDVQQQLSYKDIGIPCGPIHLGCNILLTTRMPKVCALNNCQKVIPLHPLSEEDSWVMFQKYAGITDKNSDTLKVDLAQEILRECRGITIAIKIVAVTLKGKTLAKWRELLATLRDSRPLDIEEGISVIYAAVKFSYDNLEDEEIKSLFLLCSVFPEGLEIEEESLTRYAGGLGLFGELDLYERVRNQVNVAKNKLIDCCLLLKSSNEPSVKMHTAVRGATLWIAKAGNKVIMGPEMSRQELLNYATMERKKIIYLWLNNMDYFLHEVDFSKLEILIISLKEEYVNKSFLTDQFFDGMQRLKVLVLENGSEDFNRRSSSIMYPSLLQSLTNLRCLHLIGWQLDLSFLDKLTRLETLRLWRCSFHELPKAIMKLEKLKLLDLQQRESEWVPFPSYLVIASSSQLQELYTDMFGESHTIEALQRYCIGTGRKDFSVSRSLFVQDFDTFTRYQTTKNLMARAEVLYLQRIEDCRNIIPETVQKIDGCMSETIEMELSDCEGIECLVDTTQNLLEVENVFSKLITLHLKRMRRLKNLFSGPSPNAQKMQSLRNLKFLELEDCAVLTVFPPAIAPSLVHLEELQIKQCDRLMHILTDEEGNGENADILVFSKLKRLSIIHCRRLEYIIPASYANGFVQLEELIVEDALVMQHVFGHPNSKDFVQKNFHIIPFPAVKYLSLIGLPKVTSICPANFYPTWPSLQQMKLYNCPQLDMSSINNPSVGRTISQDNPQFETLQSMKVFHCGKLRCIFPFCMAINLSQLIELVIEDCDGLENIIEDGEYDSKNRGPFNLCNLRRLIIAQCPRLRSLFTVSTAKTLTSLSTLKIEECSKLECVIRDEEVEENRSEEIVEDDGKQILPRLKTIYLVKLPSLIHVHQGFKLQDVQVAQVHDCPMLNHTTVATPEDLPHENNIPALDQKGGGRNKEKGEKSGSKQDEEGGGVGEDEEDYYYFAAEIDQPTQEFDSNVYTQECSKKQDCYPISSKNLRESDTEMAEESTHRHRDISRGEAEMATSSLEMVYNDVEEEEEHKQVEMAMAENPSAGNKFLPPSTASSRGQVDVIDQDKEEIPSPTALTYTSQGDNLNEEKDMTNNDNASGFNLNKATRTKHHGDNFNLEIGHPVAEADQRIPELDSTVENQEGLEEQNFYPVDSKNLRQSHTKIGKPSVHKDVAPKESKVATSSLELADEYKDGREEEVNKEEEDVIPEDSNVIEQNNTSYVESIETHKEVVGNPSPRVSGTGNVDAVQQDDDLNEENQRSNNDIPKGFNLSKAIGSNNHLHKQDNDNFNFDIGHSAGEVDQQTQQFHGIYNTQEDLKNLKEQNFHPVGSREATNSSLEVVEKLPQVEPELPQALNKLDAIVDNQEGLQKQNFYPVGSMNLRESNTEITKGSVHEDLAPEESKVATNSSLELVEKLPQVELELPQALKDPQQIRQEYKVSLTLAVHPTMLTPSANITTTPPTIGELISSSPRRACLLDEARACLQNEARACLLGEAFAKYPHLWEWKISQKSPRFCKWGNESLADMLEFLTSETPKAMNSLKRKKFEDLYGELESFGFDKEWLASIRQRVMNMQVDNNDKLNQLESTVSTLQDELNIAIARIASIKDDLSKLDDVFGM